MSRYGCFYPKESSVFAKKLTCKVLKKEYAAPNVVYLEFEPAKKFDFLPGQFISVLVPDGYAHVKRCYSLAGAPGEKYSLCVKVLENGLGSRYLANIEPGEAFQALAPYGIFTYEPVLPDQSVCFIATGSGVAPIRSMVYSDAFQKFGPHSAYGVFGFRTDEETLYKSEWEQAGLDVTYCISRGETNSFSGRVTDYLRANMKSLAVMASVFYICGNAEMISEVKQILSKAGVESERIRYEAFQMPNYKKKYERKKSA